MLGLVIAAFLALDAWLFLHHGIAQGLRHAIYQPLLLLGMFAGVVIATAFHEIGHATACRYGGAKPGVMGVGIYIVWPAFYTDVTDAYRLGRGGRLRTDLGGIYFNAIFALAIGGLYALTSFEPLLLLVVIQNFAMLQQLLPFLRLDGYYILSDLTGVPDMLSRIKPVFRSLKPGEEADARVTELKPWVRIAVTAYVLTVVPLLLFSLLMALIHAPRMFATAYDSLGVQYDKVSAAVERRRRDQHRVGVAPAADARASDRRPDADVQPRRLARGRGRMELVRGAARAPRRRRERRGRRARARRLHVVAQRRLPADPAR